MEGIATSRNWISFVIIFGLVFLVLYWIYLSLPEAILTNKIYYYGITAPSAALIRFVAPAESVRAVGDQLFSPGASLSIVRGCDAAGLYFLLIAAILAVKSSVLRSIAGVIGATIFVYLINQIRIFTLYFTLAYHSQWFVPLHAYAFPMLFIALGFIYFTLWLAPPPAPSNDRVPPTAK